jgi:hypothetical protein
MLVRKLDANGDYSMGRGPADWLRDQPEAVAQAVQTRLSLETGDWFLNRNEGIAWHTEVLGERTAATRDVAIRDRILGTAGLLSLDSYDSQLDRQSRAFLAQATITTKYGRGAVTATVQGA